MSAQQDKTFIRTFIGVIVFLVALTIFLVFLANSSVDLKQDERSALMRQRASERLQPVGAVRMSGEPMPEIAQAEQPGGQGGGEPMSGEQVVQQVCAACHQTGTLGAPKIGTTADWEPRLAQGLDTLVSNAVNGIRAMPPKGGNSALSEDEVKQAVVYMLEQSGLNP